MAFSNAQRVAIYARLGYAPRFLGLDSALEHAIAALGQDPDTQALVEGYLAELTQLDAERRAARKREIQSLGQGKVVWETGRADQLARVRLDAMVVVGRLASLLGVSARHNTFAPSVHVDTGPQWSPLQRGGCHGLMKLG